MYNQFAICKIFNDKQLLKNPLLFKESDQNLIDVAQAANWASDYTRRSISIENISYLIQYGRIRPVGVDGHPYVDKTELKKYYDSINKEQQWKHELGNDLNWQLSFDQYREKERTKHVHRLHPYKGKFIPQLVEYFLDEHTDQYKREVYFCPGDVVLDPFCGSGTALVQANELGIHAVGADVSAFNCVIANTKIAQYELSQLSSTLLELTSDLEHFLQLEKNQYARGFGTELNYLLSEFNARNFNSKTQVENTNDEVSFSKSKEKEFLIQFTKLVKQYEIELVPNKPKGFLDTWLLVPARKEVEYLTERMQPYREKKLWNILGVILSRTVRSSRATGHADLGTLKTPVHAPYYCRKHHKICKPPLTILNWWKRYSIDTLRRLQEFDHKRTNTHQICLHGDSRELDLVGQLSSFNTSLESLVSQQKFRGIFTSPPYVGVIDYHEQHAYAYELLEIERDDQSEIGSLKRGQSKLARDSYVAGIAEVLQFNKKYLQSDYDVFLVANDKFNLYPKIADQAHMQIVNTFKRPVLNRVEKDRGRAYSETIFHLKER